MLRKIGLSLFAFSFLFLHAQDAETARLNINNLCAPEMHGRGYFQHGDSLAADYIATKFAEEGVLAFNDNYFQDFNFDVNTFPGEMQLKVDDEDLVQGYSFLVDPASAPIKGTYSLAWLDSSVMFDKARFRAFKKDIKKKVIAVDGTDFKSPELKEQLKNIINENKFKAKAIIVVTSAKLTWSVSQEQYPFASFIVKSTKIGPNSKTVTFDVDAQFVKGYHTRNVVGYFKGSDYPDKFVAITAHYDHLGRMGKYIYFPGANDNASGVAMLLDFVRHYRYHHPKYSVLFIAFAGEEAGLVGSKFFVDHPLVPLTKIHFLMNLDLMGTGGDGITVVNATVFETETSLMYENNHFKQYVPSIETRGKAANSDHYWFSEKGVHAQFIYMRGKYTYYHDVFDRPEELGLEGYVGTFYLIRDLMKAVMDKHM
jgi:aminopeptidase YwaD